MLKDLPIILQWYLIISGMGIIFLPLTKKIFGHFFDRGYLLSKILGLLLVSYTVWLLSSLHIAPFTLTTIITVLIGWMVVNATLQISKSKFLISNQIPSSKSQTKPIEPLGLGNSLGQLGIRSIRAIRNYRIYFFEELLFLSAFLFWVWVRGHEPSIHGLEKFMDYGFMNSIFNTKYFPPADMWLTQASDPRLPAQAGYTGGFFINYYYFGQYVTAFLTKLTAIPSEITYNLMLAQIFAFCFGSSFTIGANLSYLRNLGNLSNIKKNLSQALICGLLTAFLVTMAGNLHTIYLFTSGYQNDHPVPFWQIMKLSESAPDNSVTILPGFTKYWYPNATRFIPNTIHEFPSYSWVVADLHGHVLDIPFVLLTIALLLSYLTQVNKFHSPSSKNSNIKIQISNKTQNSKLKKFGIGNLNLICPPIRRVCHLDFGFWILLLLGLLLAVMYMTNAWDGVIYFALSAMVIIARQWLTNVQSSQQHQISNFKFLISKEAPSSKFHLKEIGSLGIGNSLGQPARRQGGLGIRLIRNSINHCIVKVGIVVLAFFLFSLPFTRSFQPFVHGVGIVGGWEIANVLNGNNLPKVVRFGPFLLEQGNSLRSPLWMLGVLWGFFYVNVGIFIWFVTKKISKEIGSLGVGNSLGIRLIRSIRNLSNVELLLILLIFLSTLLLIFPEFFYMKDIYPGHYRANTMFKLGYQAFIMLSIVSGYVITQITNYKLQITNQISSSKSQTKPIGSLGVGNSLGIRIIRSILFFLLILVLVYPYFSIQSYYAPFKTNAYFRQYDSMDGIKWIKDAHPGDYETIQWFKKQLASGQIMPQDVILEAVGDSYTDYGRISSYTGLPTVLGWPVHEWLWRGSYDEPGKRVEEVRQMYEATDKTQLVDLLTKFNIKYIVIGALEWEKYKNVNETLIDDLVRPIFSSGNTTVYQRN